MRRALTLLPLLALAWPPAAPAQAGGTVTVYRCTDAAGRQSLRDTPCPKGQAQQARAMLRPRDAPSAVRPAVAPATPPAPAPVQLVVLAPPLPMYECVTPEGERYTSENGSGNPRWVPFWTLGHPAYGAGRVQAGRSAFRPAPSGNASIGAPQQSLRVPTGAPPRGPRHPAPWTAAQGGGAWVSDACTLLPPAETCARLRERRDAIRRRAFNAMPSERDLLRREERGIAARLANDCAR